VREGLALAEHRSQLASTPAFQLVVRQDQLGEGGAADHSLAQKLGTSLPDIVIEEIQGPQRPALTDRLRDKIAARIAHLIAGEDEML